MTDTSGPDLPPHVVELAERRAAARAAKDFAESDRLRDALRAEGWVISDGAAGWEVGRAEPFGRVGGIRDVPDRSAQPDTGRATVCLLVDGWPEDVRTCVEAVVAHAPPDVGVLLLDNGSTDGAAPVVHALAAAHPERVEELHVSTPGGWGEACAAMLRYDRSPVQVLMDVSTVLEGDALTPVLAAFDDRGVVGAGWRGVRVEDGWRSTTEAGTGEVEALHGYLFAVRRSAARAVPPPVKATFYRNGDLEWSFALRAAGLGRLVVPPQPLTVRQGRHHGYHDSDPDLRDRESRRTYERFLRAFRGREDLRLTPTGAPPAG